MSSTPSTPEYSSPRRGMPKWLKITTLVLLVLANLAVLAVLWAIRTGENVLATADTDSEVVRVLDPASGDSLTFLLVGSDSRAGLESLKNFGSAPGARGDVIMLVQMESGSSVARILSIPRDLWVEIPGHGENRINAAYAFGGASLLVETLKQNLDLSVNHYVEIDFVGFSDMVDELGGIEMHFPYPARDVKSGLDVEAGTQLLDGRMALAFARSRSYQELQGGSWVSVDANDIGRTQRQQDVIRAILSEMTSPGSIAEAGEVAGAMAEHMTIDSNLAAASVANLAWDFKGIITGSIEGVTLPTTGTSIGGRSVLLAKEPEATETLSSFRSGEQIAAAPLRIQVLNGNGVGGAAGEMSRTLEEKGFTVAAVGNAERTDYAQTTVVVPEGSSRGQELVTALGFGVVQTGSVDNNYDAIVIVGADAS